MNLFQEIEIGAAFTAPLANCLALAAAQVPSLVATDIEEPARKVREQFIVELAEKGQGGGMIRRKRGGVADKSAARVFVRPGNLGKFLEFWMLKEISQVAEGILVWNQVNAKFAAARIQLADPAPVSAPQFCQTDL